MLDAGWEERDRQPDQESRRRGLVPRHRRTRSPTVGLRRLRVRSRSRTGSPGSGLPPCHPPKILHSTMEPDRRDPMTTQRQRSAARRRTCSPKYRPLGGSDPTEAGAVDARGVGRADDQLDARDRQKSMGTPRFSSILLDPADVGESTGSSIADSQPDPRPRRRACVTHGGHDLAASETPGAAPRRTAPPARATGARRRRSSPRGSLDAARPGAPRGAAGRSVRACRSAAG